MKLEINFEGLDDFGTIGSLKVLQMLQVQYFKSFLELWLNYGSHIFSVPKIVVSLVLVEH